jgi:hypothetical protein
MRVDNSRITIRPNHDATNSNPHPNLASLTAIYKCEEWTQFTAWFEGVGLNGACLANGPQFTAWIKAILVCFDPTPRKTETIRGGVNP